MPCSLAVVTAVAMQRQLAQQATGSAEVGAEGHLLLHHFSWRMASATMLQLADHLRQMKQAAPLA